MARTGDLIVVHFPAEVKAGYRFERRRLQWPLHITLAPWFSAPDKSEVHERLQSVAHTSDPFKYTVGEVEYFGRRRDVPVNVIEHTEQLNALQALIVRTLLEAGVVFMPGAHIDNFQAHITHHGDARQHEGEELQFADFHAVKLDENNICEVLEQYRLGL